MRRKRKRVNEKSWGKERDRRREKGAEPRGAGVRGGKRAGKGRWQWPGAGGSPRKCCAGWIIVCLSSGMV